MIRQYVALSNQNIYDVCLMTYGTLDRLFKLMLDNDFPGVNNYPYNGQRFNWDDTLIYDEQVFISNTASGTRYATRANTTGNINYNVSDGSILVPLPPLVPPVIPIGFTYTFQFPLS